MAGSWEMKLGQSLAGCDGDFCRLGENKGVSSTSVPWQVTATISDTMER